MILIKSGNLPLVTSFLLKFFFLRKYYFFFFIFLLLFVIYDLFYVIYAIKLLIFKKNYDLILMISIATKYKYKITIIASCNVINI